MKHYVSFFFNYNENYFTKTYDIHDYDYEKAINMADELYTSLGISPFAFAFSSENKEDFIGSDYVYYLGGTIF